MSYTMEIADPPMNAKRDNSLDVLIVDDDEMVCARLTALLEAEGRGALSVGSVEAAKQAVNAVYFPILILDRRLTDGDGIDLCRELRALRPASKVFIVILSALDSPTDIAAGMHAGADDYVSKRSSDETLLAKLRQATTAMKL